MGQQFPCGNTVEAKQLEGVPGTAHFQGVCCSFCPGQVLELCYNAVGDLQDLCAQPPPQLQHLGLGYNRLCGPSQEKHLTVDFW